MLSHCWATYASSSPAFRVVSDVARIEHFGSLRSFCRCLFAFLLVRLRMSRQEISQENSQEIFQEKKEKKEKKDKKEKKEKKQAYHLVAASATSASNHQHEAAVANPRS